MRMLQKWSSGVLYLVLANAVLHAGTLVLGNPPLKGTGNCDPFGCPQFFGLGTYQQVYLNTAFPGPIDINSITFYEGQVFNGAGVPGGTYTLSFSYTSALPGGLSLSDPANNIGSGSQEFYSGALPALSVNPGGNLLTISGVPFVYNPADGDLLLTVSVTNGLNPTPFLYLNEATCGPKTLCPAGSSVVSSNAYFGNLNGSPVVGGNDTGGLVTGLSYTSPTGQTTPEPVSMLLSLTGLGLIGIQGWRLRKRQS